MPARSCVRDELWMCSRRFLLRATGDRQGAKARNRPAGSLAAMNFGSPGIRPIAPPSGSRSTSSGARGVFMGTGKGSCIPLGYRRVPEALRRLSSNQRAAS